MHTYSISKMELATTSLRATETMYVVFADGSIRKLGSCYSPHRRGFGPLAIWDLLRFLTSFEMTVPGK